MRVCLSALVRGWRAALLLAAAACATPGKASASCGDYVTILNGQSNSDHHATPAAPGETPTPAKPPCRGPNCSGSPTRDAPPVPPPAPVSTPAKELTHNLGTLGGADGPRDPFARDASSPRPVRRASSVFHPPRLG